MENSFIGASAFAVFAAVVTAIGGFVTHLIWVFGLLTSGESAVSGGQVLMALIGCLVPPIGALHGVYLWFL